MFYSKSSIIILMGPPGAGKDTQADLLSDKFNFFHFRSSKIIEKRIKRARKNEFIEVKGKKYYFSEEKKKLESGALCDPPFTVFLIKEQIGFLAEEEMGIVFSGSPRSVYEADAIIPFIEGLYGKDNIFVFLIEVSPQISLFRNSHRRICSLIRHPVIYNKQTINLKNCPLDGSEIIFRGALDKPEVVKIRLKEYQKRTFPVIEYFKKQKIKVMRINGEASPAEVFQEILQKLPDNSNT